MQFIMEPVGVERTQNGYKMTKGNISILSVPVQPTGNMAMRMIAILALAIFYYTQVSTLVIKLTNSMAYGTRRFNATFKRALE